MQSKITEKLNEAFSPEHLDVVDESHMHSVPDGAQSHFKVTLVTDEFTGKMLIARHRLVNKVLEDELSGSIHALALHTMTMEEWFAKGKAPDSPECLGGGK